jgi:hypothetical protein
MCVETDRNQQCPPTGCGQNSTCLLPLAAASCLSWKLFWTDQEVVWVKNWLNIISRWAVPPPRHRSCFRLRLSKQYSPLLHPNDSIWDYQVSTIIYFLVDVYFFCFSMFLRLILFHLTKNCQSTIYTFLSENESKVETKNKRKQKLTAAHIQRMRSFSLFENLTQLPVFPSVSPFNPSSQCPYLTSHLTFHW